LRGRTAYIVGPDNLRAVDVLTGKQQWRAAIEGTPVQPDAPQGPFVNDAGPRPPAVSSDGKTVVAAVPVAEPGKGTTPGHQAISVLAVDADSGRAQWSTKVPVSADVAGDLQTSAVTDVVAVTDVAVVVTYHDEGTTTAVIDPSNRKTLWQRDHYKASTVIGETVFGTEFDEPTEMFSHMQATALDLTTDQQRWTAAPASSAITVIPAGKDAVVVDRIDYDSGNGNLLFLDPATGQEQADVGVDRPLGAQGSVFGTCTYDQRSVIICLPYQQQVIAYDATTGKAL
jgi:outer membrane protein assembly factor BamB